MVMDRQRHLTTEEFFDEELMHPLDPLVHFTGIRLRMYADDHGRETTTLHLLKAGTWPGHPQVTEELILDHLLMLDEVGYIGIYTVGERTYYQVREWPSVSHPKPSKYPPPPANLFQRFASSSLDDFSAGEREREPRAESAEESPVWMSAGVPPSPFCKVHQPAGSGGKPCHHCQDARLAHQQWILEHRAEGTSQ